MFCANDIQGRKLCWHDFIKYTYNIIMCQDTCEPVYFKLSMMLNISRLYSLIPVEWPWCSLKVTGLWEKLEHFVIKLHEASQMFMVVDYVRGMTVKKSCKYCEWRSCECLLFLIIADSAIFELVVVNLQSNSFCFCADGTWYVCVKDKFGLTILYELVRNTMSFSFLHF